MHLNCLSRFANKNTSHQYRIKVYQYNTFIDVNKNITHKLCRFYFIFWNILFILVSQILHQTFQVLWILIVVGIFIHFDKFSSIEQYFIHLNNFSSIWMNFTTIFIGDSILLWPLVILVVHSIWNVWCSKMCLYFYCMIDMECTSK